MAVVLVLAVWLGWYLHTVRTQQAAVRAIKEAGGWVAYDWDWANYDPNITSYQGKLRAPKWLSNLAGVGYVANVGQVSLVSGNCSGLPSRNCRWRRTGLPGSQRPLVCFGRVLRPWRDRARQALSACRRGPRF